MGETKKGYSIWSLLVIMTLIAVWLAIPTTLSLGKWPDTVLGFFILFHQITLWTLIASIIWLFTGRRRVVLYLLTGIITVFWGPFVLVAFERCLFKSEYVAGLLVRTGLSDVLDPVYSAIYEVFSYEPH